ncbi:uncharacterized protein BJ212DRAFT_1352414 [Suillus subaureus]|uniref:Uncharacterized protein n=1 Tax=Suillus subaureus TaxID=48587 RepID=A0A9P7EB78_9AGAM|nr:uncharacterized protein BJ212DRAFT_1352414 [Suillus subaureus]KAG1816682.1 hypothetical protein BJ212DRAFT_1352414 [Suillus subaureus]
MSSLKLDDPSLHDLRYNHATYTLRTSLEYLLIHLLGLLGASTFLRFAAPLRAGIVAIISPPLGVLPYGYLKLKR